MKKIITLFATALMAVASLQAAPIKPFTEGDRAVFLGNSITDGGRYHSYIWLYYMTHFPEMPIKIVNGGIGGDTAYDMNKRLDDNIFNINPTVLMVTFGMNDSGYFEYNGADSIAFGEKKYQEGVENFNKMVERFKGLENTRIVMVGTSPYDEYAKIPGNLFHGKNRTIERLIDYQIQTAKDNGWEYTDWCAPMVTLNRENQKNDSTFTLCGSDRIHPDNHGHMVMAYLFLKEQGMAGLPVADIDINASKMKVEKQENCAITNLKKVGREVQFNYLANSLPFPTDTIARGWGFSHPMAEAKNIIPLVEDLNTERLKVTGLKGDYKLIIEGEEIGTFSAAQLAEGINMGEMTNTPQYQQALVVMFLNESRSEIERKFREYSWCQHGFFQQHGMLGANNRQAIEVLDRHTDENLWLRGRRDLYQKMMHKEVRDAMVGQMDLLIDKIYEVNKPRNLQVVLRPVTK